MKVKALSLFFAILFIAFTVSACGTADAKSVYKPPAEVFDVKISGTSEPKIDGVKFTYDSKARIETVCFTIDDYEYTQQYSYDNPEQIEIKTIYKTEVIEEKVIKYVEIPIESGFTSVDGYIIRVTDDMPVNEGNSSSNNSNNSDSGNSKSDNTKETSVSTGNIDYNNLVTSAKEITAQYYSGGSVDFRIPKVLLNSSDAKSVNSEILNKYQDYFNGETNGLVQLDYVYYTYNDLLSVIIGAQGEGGGGVSYSVYTFSIQTGNLLNNDDIRKYFSINDSKVIEKLRNAEDNHFGDIFDYNWSQEIISIYNDAYDQTVNNNNLKDYRLFIGNKGLMAIIREYTMAGQGDSEVAVDVENEHVYRYFSELLAEY